jgi:hypothetical protein
MLVISLNQDIDRKILASRGRRLQNIVVSVRIFFLLLVGSPQPNSRVGVYRTRNQNAFVGGREPPPSHLNPPFIQSQLKS